MRARWATFPLWVRALLIYVTLRVLILPAFVFAWTRQLRSPSFFPDHVFYPDQAPDFLSFLALSWDAGWYREIALHGYPAELPRDPDTGTVLDNPWAFYPLFPFAARVVMTVTTLPWVVVGPLLAFIIGGLAVVMIAYLVRSAAPEAVAARPGLPELAVAGLAAFPSAATMMVAYSETTALALIAASLLLIHRRAYLWALLPVGALGFARAAALPMAAVVVWHAVMRWREDRRAGSRWPASTWLRLGGLATVAVASGFAWPIITGIATGVPDAYLQTQTEWRNGSSASTPFLGFVAKMTEWVGPFAIPAVIAACVAVVLISLSRPARMLGPELQSWGGAYLFYLIAVGTLSSSLLRFALLSITLPLAFVAWPRRRWLQVTMIGVLLLAQAAWIVRIWVYDGAGDWFPP